MLFITTFGTVSFPMAAALVAAVGVPGALTVKFTPLARHDKTVLSVSCQSV